MSTPQEQNAALGINPKPMLIISSIMLALTTTFICLRLYVRVIMLKSMAKDDWLLVASQCAYISFSSSAFAIAYMQLRIGPVDALYSMIGSAIAVVVSYIFCMIFLKMALAAFYLKFVTSTWQRRTIVITVAVYAFYYMVPLFVIMFQCGLPYPQNFLLAAQCPLQWNVVGPVNYAGAVLNAITDWILTIVPVLNISKLHLPPKDKILASCLVGLGAVASIISIVRIPLISQLRVTGDLYFFANIQGIEFISMSEMAIGIVATCFSALRPLWKSKDASTKITGTFGSGNLGPSKRRTHDATLLQPTCLGHEEGNVVVVTSTIDIDTEKSADSRTQVTYVATSYEDLQRQETTLSRVDEEQKAS